MDVSIPRRLVEACGDTPERRAWVERLPRTVREVERRWSLTLAAPCDGPDVSAAWVAPAIRADGNRAVLKVGMPHMEAAHEIQGLRFWNGDGTVYLLESDEELNALLLERCEPGTSLRQRSEPEQDVVVTTLLKRLWRRPAHPHDFRPLAAMIESWRAETIADDARWPDRGLVHAGLQQFSELSAPSPDDVLLATDLHAGNVLCAEREPWLAIDPKPFVGDRAYDATQHLLNCRERLLSAPDATIRSVAAHLGVDANRVRCWMFARAAAEPRDNWNDNLLTLARRLAP